MNASVWRAQIDALSADYDVVAYDMLGHGGSRLPPADPRLSDYAGQLLALVDGLDLAAFHVVGHSMGALVSLEFALAHPERVRSVVALNAVYCRTPEQKAAVLHRASALEAPEPSDSPEATIARWFGDPVPSSLAAEAEMVRRLLLSVDRAGYSRTYRLFAKSDEVHRGKLERLSVPALFMTGELDPNSTPAMSRAMSAAARNGRCEIIPGARHMMTVTAPQEVNRRLRAFLSSVGRVPLSDHDGAVRRESR